jgi:hypothetical protein
MSMLEAGAEPPPLRAARWIHAAQPPSLAALRGRVVAVYAFQMLCPGCVAQSLPQAARLHEAVPDDELALIGLHTVFEHHAAMQPEALEVFVHEYRLRFPIGVDDASDDGPIPATMAAWGLRGTPSLVLLDRAGRTALAHFGHLPDLQLGLVLGRLLQEAAPAAHAAGAG